MVDLTGLMSRISEEGDARVAGGGEDRMEMG